MPISRCAGTSRVLPRSTRFRLLAAIILPVVTLDLLSKWIVFHTTQARIELVHSIPRVVTQQEIQVIPAFFDLQCVMNPGAFRGWFGGWSWLLIAISAVALATIITYTAVGYISRRTFIASLACIAAGTAGNLYDRIVYGAVRDFLHFYIHLGGRQWSWPNFNIADMAICTGVGLWMLVALTEDRPPTPRSG